jgi:tetratricopeptide (TPR) repeat protein
MLKEHLKRQLGFLKRSCEIFDQGNEDEAIRIAVTLRTLFRDTRNSTSLMKLLGQMDTVQLLSTLETEKDEPRLKQINIKEFVPVMLTSNGKKPYLDASNKKRMLSLDNWLNEKILILNGKRFSREDIIITAANKDGGTHVPKKLNQKAKFLKKSIGKYTILENKRHITNELNNHHFFILRQLAYEVLNSRKLYELNGIEFHQPDKVKSYREYLIEAENFQKEKRHFKAIESFRNAIKAKPNSAEIAYNNMGNSFTELEEYDDAMNSYCEAIKLNPGYVDPLFNLSRLYYREKRYDLVMSTYEKILKIDATHKQAIHNFHVITNYLTLEEELVYQYENVFPKSENISYLHYLCLGLMKHKRYVDALNVVQKALELSKDNITVLCNIGVIHLKLKNFNEAEEIFEQLSHLDSDRLEVCLNILEYKLIYNNHCYEDLIQKYTKQFKGDKNSLMLLTMLSMFLKARDGNTIDTDIQIFERKFPNITIDYNLNEIYEWIILHESDNENLLEALSYFKNITKG